MKRIKWLLLVVVGLYYCATPVSYERATIEPGVYGHIGASGTLFAGKWVSTTSCYGDGFSTTTPYTGALAKMDAEIGYGLGTKFALGIRFGVGGGLITSSDATAQGFLPSVHGGLVAKLGTRIGTNALAYKVGVGLPMWSQQLMFGLGTQEKVTLSLRHTILGQDGGWEQEVSLWITFHRDKTAVSVGVGHESEPDGSYYNFITGGIGWKLR